MAKQWELSDWGSFLNVLKPNEHEKRQFDKLDRKLYCIIAQLHNIGLCKDLHKLGLIENALGTCGKLESVEHYLRTTLWDIF